MARVIKKELVIELVIDGEPTRHHFDGKEVDLELVGLMKSDLMQKVTQAIKKEENPPAEVLEEFAACYDRTIKSVEGYEYEDGSPVEPQDVPVLDKVNVWTAVIYDRMNGAIPPKNSKTASVRRRKRKK